LSVRTTRFSRGPGGRLESVAGRPIKSTHGGLWSFQLACTGSRWLHQPGSASATRLSRQRSQCYLSEEWRCASLGYTLPLPIGTRSEEHTSELQSHLNLVCRLLLEKKKYNLK